MALGFELFWVSLAGFALLITTGLVSAARVPGLHFDEAWAANFAYRILSEKGFWPIDAMSPYTHPWAHYWTAAFFKIFGTSLLVYRAAGVSMCVLGALFASIALYRIGEKKAAAIFPFILALFVPFVLNERLCVEITTFHVFCLGLLVLGAQMRSLTLMFLATLFGTTAHILFLAPVLALLGVWGLQSGKWQNTHRALALVLGLSLWPFLWKVFREIPEKDKAVLLLGADLLVIGFVLFFDQMPRWIRRMRENIQWLVAVLSIPFFLDLLIFSEGHWSVLFSQGHPAHPWVLLFSVPATVAGGLYLLRRYQRESWLPSERRFWIWVLFTVFWVGALAVKPAPRYFQCSFFVMAMGAAILLGHESRKTILKFMLPFAAISLMILILNYLVPGAREEARNQSYRFLFLRDGSGDSLPKTGLVSYLGARGCDFSRVATADPRLEEALRFLSIGDWPVNTSAVCPGTKVEIQKLLENSSDPNGLGQASRVFGQFILTWKF